MVTNNRTKISMRSKRSDDYKEVSWITCTSCLLQHMLRLHRYPSSLLCFPPLRHSLELVLLLSAIQGKQSPAELICFLHQWFATSPLAFSLTAWKTLMVSRAGNRAASPTSTQSSTHTHTEMTRLLKGFLQNRMNRQHRYHVHTFWHASKSESNARSSIVFFFLVKNLLFTTSALPSRGTNVRDQPPRPWGAIVSSFHLSAHSSGG